MYISVEKAKALTESERLSYYRGFNNQIDEFLSDGEFAKSVYSEIEAKIIDACSNRSNYVSWNSFCSSMSENCNCTHRLIEALSKNRDPEVREKCADLLRDKFPGFGISIIINYVNEISLKFEW